MTKQWTTGWVAALSAAMIASVASCSGDKREPTAEAKQALLTGSDFEIDENLVAQAGKDWSSVLASGDFAYRLDLPHAGSSDSADQSFGKGAKEESLEPSIVTGSIPPNKNDFTRFYVYTETRPVSGQPHLFFNFAWFRTNDTGTSNQDVELNRVAPTEEGTGNSKRLVTHRSNGDVLITFDTAANNANLVRVGMALWGSPHNHAVFGALSCIASNTAPCWLGRPDATDNNKVNSILLTGTYAEGRVNTAEIPDITGAGGGGPGVMLGVRTMGEAAVDLTAAGVIDATRCSSLNSAFLKSRSSDSFPAELKDYVPPIGINVGNCSVNLNKTDDNGVALAGAVFGLYHDTGADGVCAAGEKTNGNRVLVDGAPVTCTTNASGTCTTPMSVELFGKYCVFEVSAPAGYAIDPVGKPVELTAQSRNVTISAAFVNPRLFKVITFVCKQVDNTLYASRITLDGTEMTSLTTLPAGLDASVLCGLGTGAVFENKQKGGHPGNACIPLTSGAACAP